MTQLGRKVVICNLDPSNDGLVYDCDVDIRNLVKAEDVANQIEIGPNAVQVYCIDLLASRLDWIGDQLGQFNGAYFLFDCPGQFELYTDCESMKTIVDYLTRVLKVQLTAVTLVDCLLCTSGHSFISAVVMSLSMMIHLGLPHVNVLSKMDTLRRVAPEMAFNLEYYLRAGNGSLEALIQNLFPAEPHPLDVKYSKFIGGISEVAEQFSLVSFVPLAIEDKEMALHCLSVCDSANGFTYSGADNFRVHEEVHAELESKFADSLEFEANQAPFCASCGAEAGADKLLRCLGCEKVYYCNRECQKVNWPVHKDTCDYKQRL